MADEWVYSICGPDRLKIIDQECGDLSDSVLGKKRWFIGPCFQGCFQGLGIIGHKGPYSGNRQKQRRFVQGVDCGQIRGDHGGRRGPGFSVEKRVFSEPVQLMGVGAVFNGPHLDALVHRLGDDPGCQGGFSCIRVADYVNNFHCVLIFWIPAGGIPIVYGTCSSRSRKTCCGDCDQLIVNDRDKIV